MFDGIKLVRLDFALIVQHFDISNIRLHINNNIDKKRKKKKNANKHLLNFFKEDRIL